MDKHKIFISSVQKEFKTERMALRDFITRDPLCQRYFDVFLFEDIPSRDRNPDSMYLEEVKNCDIYLCLLGKEYGTVDANGVSSTEREFLEATKQCKIRLLFISDGPDGGRHPKTARLIRKAGGEMIRRKFLNISELITQVYASLVQYLEDEGVLLTVPFDAAVCRGAVLNDIDQEYVKNFWRQHVRNASFLCRKIHQQRSYLSILIYLLMIKFPMPRCYCFAENRKSFVRFYARK